MFYVFNTCLSRKIIIIMMMMILLSLKTSVNTDTKHKAHWLRQMEHVHGNTTQNCQKHTHTRLTVMSFVFYVGSMIGRLTLCVTFTPPTIIGVPPHPDWPPTNPRVSHNFFPCVLGPSHVIRKSRVIDRPFFFFVWYDLYDLYIYHRVVSPDINRWFTFQPSKTKFLRFSFPFNRQSVDDMSQNNSNNNDNDNDNK